MERICGPTKIWRGYEVLQRYGEDMRSYKDMETILGLVKILSIGKKGAKR